MSAAATVADLQRLGLSAAASTLAAVAADERDEARATARRLRRRAGHLEKRAATRALNSNGQRKDRSKARVLRAQADHVLAVHGISA